MEPTTLAIQAASGLIVGSIVGIAVRKAGQIILTVLGFFMLGVIGLAYFNIITVNWDGLANLISNLFNWIGFQTGSIMAFLSSAAVFGATFIVGMLLTGLFSSPATMSIFRSRRRFVVEKNDEKQSSQILLTQLIPLQLERFKKNRFVKNKQAD